MKLYEVHCSRCGWLYFPDVSEYSVTTFCPLCGRENIIIKE